MNISRRTFAGGAALAAIAGVSRFVPVVAQTPTAGDLEEMYGETSPSVVGVAAPWSFVDDLPVAAEGEATLNEGGTESFAYDRFSLEDDEGSVAEIALVAEFSLTTGSGTYQLGDQTILNFDGEVIEGEVETAEDSTLSQALLVVTDDDVLGVYRTVFDGFTQSRGIMFQAPVDEFTARLETFMSSVFIDDVPVWEATAVDPAAVQATLDAMVEEAGLGE